MNVKIISKKVRNSNFFYAEIVLHLSHCYVSDRKHDEYGFLAFNKCQTHIPSTDPEAASFATNKDIIIIAEIHRAGLILEDDHVLQTNKHTSAQALTVK